jgi:hypothetical protein
VVLSGDTLGLAVDRAVETVVDACLHAPLQVGPIREVVASPADLDPRL